MSHPRTQLQRVGCPDTEDNDRVRHPQTENDRNQKDTDETASWKRRERPWFALLEFALLVEVPRGIADERDSADRTVTPTGNKTKMNGFVEISTLLIHSAPKQKSNEWMHLSPFYTRMHGEWLRYAKSTSQFHWRFLLVRDVRGFQVNPLCRHDITRSDRQIGNTSYYSHVLTDISHVAMLREIGSKCRSVVCDVWTWCYCSSSLNVNMQLLISLHKKQIQYTSNYNYQILYIK